MGDENQQSFVGNHTNQMCDLFIPLLHHFIYKIESMRNKHEWTCWMLTGLRLYLPLLENRGMRLFIYCCFSCLLPLWHIVAGVTWTWTPSGAVKSSNSPFVSKIPGLGTILRYLLQNKCIVCCLHSSLLACCLLVCCSSLKSSWRHSKVVGCLLLFLNSHLVWIIFSSSYLNLQKR
jgi:hypothetical protein